MISHVAQGTFAHLPREQAILARHLSCFRGSQFSPDSNIWEIITVLIRFIFFAQISDCERLEEPHVTLRREWEEFLHLKSLQSPSSLQTSDFDSIFLFICVCEILCSSTCGSHKLILYTLNSRSRTLTVRTGRTGRHTMSKHLDSKAGYAQN